MLNVNALCVIALKALGEISFEVRDTVLVGIDLKRG
jgi:hypothetical protein